MNIERHPESAFSYDDSPPVLLFGEAGSATDEVENLVSEAGLRLAARGKVEGAVERIGQQVRHGLIWIECDHAAPDTGLLEQVGRLAADGEADVILSIGSEAIDEVVATLPSSDAQILVDPGTIERAGALALALSRRGQEARVSDVGRDNAVQLRQISDEMGRIAATLARLSSGPGQAAPQSIPFAADPSGEPPELDADMVRNIIRARRLRARYFDEDLFADPAWDMLLDLTQAEIAQHRVPVSSLCIAAAVPATTALRWIKTMTDAGIFVRRKDLHDGRRVFVELSSQASRAMRGYFAEVGALLGA